MYIYANSRIIAQHNGDHTASRYFYLHDRLGSVRQLIDNSGTMDVKNRYTYDVFGQPDNTGSIGNPYFFTARRLDTETSLYYFRARYYAYDIGRFLQTDPIGYSDGINWYLYCGNNPINYKDPRGLYFGLDDALAAGGGAIVGLAAQGIGDLWNWELSGWADYGIAALSGAAGGEALIYAGPFASGAAAAGTRNVLTQLREWGQDKRDSLSGYELGKEVLIGGAVGKLTAAIPAPKIKGINVGRNSYKAVGKQMLTKNARGQISRVSAKTLGKMLTANTVEGIPEIVGVGLLDGLYRQQKKQKKKLK